MGCIIGRFNNLKLENQMLVKQNVGLTTQLDELKTLSHKQNLQIYELSATQKELLLTQAIVNKRAELLDNQLYYIRSVLGNSSDIAGSILLSNLNCDWIDDEKEKIYLISIIDFLYQVCIAENKYNYNSLEQSPAKSSESMAELDARISSDSDS